MSDRPIIHYAALSDFETDSFWHRARRRVLWEILNAGAAIAILAVFMVPFAVMHPTGMYVGLIACLISVSMGAAGMRAARRRRSLIVLSYVDQAMRLNLPLPLFLHAAALGESHSIARRLEEIARTIEASAPLGDALASELPELPVRDAEIIRVAEANGSAPAALARLARDARWQPVDDLEAEAGVAIPLAYLAAFSLAFSFAFFFGVFFVMPKLNAIMRDFHVPRPASWAFINALSSDEWTGVAIGLAVVAALTAGSVVGRSVKSIFFARLRRPPPLRRFFDTGRPASSRWTDIWLLRDRLLWHIPILGGSIRDRDWGDVCTALGDALAYHRPLDVAVREAAAQRHLSNITGERLDRWASLLFAGGPTALSARQALLPSVIVGFLGDRTPASAEAFAFLGRHYRSRYVQRSRWVAAMAMPALTLICGALVTGFAFLFFVPLWTIIDATIPPHYRVKL